MEFDDYGSHLYVFEKLFADFNINNVLEFGLGRHSTAYFVEHAKFVISIEQQSKKWQEKISGKIKSPNWHHVFQVNPIAVFQYFEDKGVKFDLVFSDGAARTRCLVANMAMRKNIPVVVLHDAEKIWYYRWDLLDIPSNYSRYDFRCKKGGRKVTAIITNHNADLIDCWDVPEHERIMQAYSSPGQKIVQFRYPGDKKISSQSNKTVSSS